MDNQNTYFKVLGGYDLSVLILVLMDNQNTLSPAGESSIPRVLILVLMDNQNTPWKDGYYDDGT